jgi:hypothetical protein
MFWNRPDTLQYLSCALSHHEVSQLLIHARGQMLCNSHQMLCHILTKVRCSAISIRCSVIFW